IDVYDELIGRRAMAAAMAVGDDSTSVGTPTNRLAKQSITAAADGDKHKTDPAIRGMVVAPKVVAPKKVPAEPADPEGVEMPRSKTEEHVLMGTLLPDAEKEHDAARAAATEPNAADRDEPPLVVGTPLRESEPANTQEETSLVEGVKPDTDEHDVLDEQAEHKARAAVALALDPAAGTPRGTKTTDPDASKQAAAAVARAEADE